MQAIRLDEAPGGRAHAVRRANGDDHKVIKSAGRALRIFELFDRLQRESTVSEVSDLLGYPQSSTSQLLRSMAVLGYLALNPETRAYAPTTRVALLGSWIGSSLVCEGRLLRLLERINGRTQQAVVLAVRNQIWSQYIHLVQANAPGRLFVVKGAQRPLVLSGTGLALIADLPEAEIKRLALRYNAQAEPGERQASVSQTLEQVQTVRRTGYAFTCDTVTPGGGMIAMRLQIASNSEAMAVGVGGSTEVLQSRRDDFVEALREETAAYLAEHQDAPPRFEAPVLN